MLQFANEICISIPEIILSTCRQTVKTLMKSRSLLFAKYTIRSYRYKRVEAQNGSFANSADQ